MANRRGRSSAPPPRKPETAAELVPLVQALAIKTMDRGDGQGANWPLIAEAMLTVAFHALDQRPDDPKTHALLRRTHAGAEQRITQNPAYSTELFKPETDKELRNTYGFDPAPSPATPGK